MATNEAPEGDLTAMLDGLRGTSRILGLREDFLFDLLGEKDDWSFVVKSHALLESAVCTLISLALGRDELEDVLAEEVEMKARIEITKALDITTSDDRRAMRVLGQLRNKLVHSAKNTGFTFSEHLRNRDVLRSFSDAFGRGWPDPLPDGVSRAAYVAAHPREAVFQSIVTIALHVITATAKRRTNAALDALRKLGDESIPDVTSDAPAE